MKKQLLNRKKLMQLVLSLFLILVSANTSWGQGVTQTTPGTYSYTVPAGVTSIKISTWGAGGAGGSAQNAGTNTTTAMRGGGGAGGSYASTTISVTTGDVISYTVGAGGTALSSGFTNAAASGAGNFSSASLNGTLVVKSLGGPGGISASASGTASANGAGGAAYTTGNTGSSFYGGNGGTTASGGSGGGGGSAGTAISGNNGSGGSGGFAGGTAVTGGGAGGSGSNLNNAATAGSVGGSPGGGGGGGNVRNISTAYAAGGSGGAGKVVISYPIISKTGSFSSLSTVAGVASGSTSIGVTGADMESAITATASAGFEVSSNNSTFSSAITSTATSGSISFPTIYVRFAASATEGTYASGTVTFTGTNAVSVVATIPSSTVSSASVAAVTVSTTSLSTPFAKMTAGTNSSTSQSFTVSGVNLGANVITIAAPTHFKISLTDVDANYSSNSIDLTPSSGTVGTTTIYVKYSPTGSGNISGNSDSISITNASVAPQTVSVTGAGLNAFYYNSGSLATLGSWKALSNGSGDSPADFTTAGITYTILTNATTDASWTVSGSGSKVIVGNGSAVSLTVADTFPITGTIDAAANGSIYWKHVLASPTFGILHSNSEVHLQPTTPAIGLTSVTYAIPGTTFGKLFIDGAAPINLSNGHTVNTLFSIAEGSQLILPTQTSHYIYINTGASAIINGTVKSIKKTGIFSFNNQTPNGNTGIQFKDSGSTLTLNTTSTIDYSSINGIQTISSLPSGSSYANLTLSENGTNITSSSIKEFPALTIIGNFTINTPGNSSFPSSTTGAGSITLANGATIVRTSGALDAPPLYSGTYNVTYNGTTAQTTGFELPIATSDALNNLTINNPAGVTMKTSSDVTVSGTLTFTSGNLVIGSNTLKLNGAVVNTSGTLTGSSTSNLTIGSTAGTLNFTSGSRALNNLSLGASGVATLGSSLDIYGLLGFTSGGSLNMNAQAVTLKSTSTATARVSNLTSSTLSGATNVTVERYIPAKRSWRALTAPLKGSGGSIFNQWQNGGNTITGVGVELWGPGGTGSSANGLAVGPSSSILQYISGAWSPVENTKTMSLFNTSGNNAFMVFPTGGYGSGLISSSSTPTPTALETTLKATGQLITGDVSYSNLSDTNHTLIGNPYASPIDLNSILDANASLQKYFWVWDPNGANQGAYNLFDATANTYSVTNLSYTNSTVIQSGQAFFVKAAAGQTGSFTISESNKSNATATTVFRNAAPELLRVGLYKLVNTEWSGRDGAMTVILSDANANQTPNKMANGTENVAFSKNGLLFASNHHLPLVANDVLNVKVWNTNAGANYKLKIYTEEFTATNLNATLEDLFTNARTPLSLDSSAVEYPFTVTTDALSSGNRFRIVFQNAVLGTNNPIATGFSIVPNPVTGDSFQVNLGSLAKGNYSYTICNTIGLEVEKGSINNVAQNTNYTVKLSNTLTGIYIMKLTGTDNSVFTAKIIKK